MVQKIKDNIYKIEVPMRDGSLNCLNAYFIRGERNLLIDTGFDLDEPFNTISEALFELKTSMAETDIFLTHMHPDHAELAGRLAEKNTKIYLGAADIEFMKYRFTSLDLKKVDPAGKGFPPEAVVAYERIYALRRPFGKHPCEYIPVRDGDELEYGGYKLLCIDCAGHSPGQTCLYIKELKLLFAGDHILYDITPNVSVWDIDSNPLKDFIRNLKKLKAFDIQIALPAHRSITCGAHERIDEILKHHDERLEETLELMRKNGAMNPYEIASKLTWNTGCTWDELPPHQKFSAVGEVLAHLNYLLSEGKVEKEIINGVIYFKIK